MFAWHSVWASRSALVGHVLCFWYSRVDVGYVFVYETVHPPDAPQLFLGSLRVVT